MAVPSQRGLGQHFMKTVGLVEAPLGSAWRAALYMADCKQLMELLEENPCLVVQKGKGGFTVLHAAAMRGCLKLLDQVFELFQVEREPTELHVIYIDGCWELGNEDFDLIQDKDWRFVDEREGIELSLWELYKAKSCYGREEKIGAAGLTTAELAWWCMGDCDARRYLDVGRRSWSFQSYKSEIFGSSIQIIRSSLKVLMRRSYCWKFSQITEAYLLTD